MLRAHTAVGVKLHQLAVNHGEMCPGEVELKTVLSSIAEIGDMRIALRSVWLGTCVWQRDPESLQWVFAERCMQYAWPSLVLKI